MKTRTLVLAMACAAAACVLCSGGTAWADDSPAAEDACLKDYSLTDLCQVKGDDLWIRLTPGQYRTAKARSRVKRRGAIRITLRLRQVEAINEALGTDRNVPKLLLKVNAVELRRSRLPRERAESHFIVRPVDSFKREFVEGLLDA